MKTQNPNNKTLININTTGKKRIIMFKSYKLFLANNIDKKIHERKNTTWNILRD